MKTILFTLLGLLPLSILSQQTITSVSNGVATNPLVWDCSCFPNTFDNVIVNHDIVMTTDWLINNGGSVTVNSGGRLTQDTQSFSILIDGNGSNFVNHGTTEMTSFAVISGAEVTNHHIISLDTALWVGTGSTYTNHGSTIDLDSTYNQGTFINNGTLKEGDLLNDGTFTNTGYVLADSLANRGTFTSSAGNIKAFDFGNNADFELSGTSFMHITNNAYNDGQLTLTMGRDLYIGNDFANINSGSGSTVTNDGMVQVSNDFLNAAILDGSGVFCMSNLSTNTGSVLGTLDICDNTGMGYFDLNTGTIAPGVTDCISGCSVATDQEALGQLTVFPNPVVNTLHIDGTIEGDFRIVDLAGKEILSGEIQSEIDMSNFSPAVYYIHFYTQNGASTIKFIKQ
nr:T9SS type A sorting domain-containing protein [uncultured Brumimicrobium sp.]